MSAPLRTTPDLTSRHQRVERPASVTEAAELLRDTAGSVLLRGGASKIDWAGRVRDPDLVVDTTDLQGMLTHNPADMTASVRAGTTLDALQARLGEAGQWLALDPPSAGAGATVGGLLAAGDSGPSRLRYGGLRDLVIGATLVLADGTVARSGSHVIKNVAGYDLTKLMHGSLGSLGLIAEVIVRLHPRPAASATAAGAATAAQATAAALALAASPSEPAAVEWVSAPGAARGQLYVRVDGTPTSVGAATPRLLDLLGDLDISAELLADDAAAQAWSDHAVAVRGAGDETVVRVAGLPGELAAFADAVRTAADHGGLDVHLVSSAALGMHTVRLGAGPARAHAGALGALRRHAKSRGASLLLCRRSAEVDDLVDALGQAPSTVELLRRVKARFDPTGRYAPGRFQPWY